MNKKFKCTYCSTHRHSSDKVSKLEGTVEYYKKKLEDLGVLRRQVHATHNTHVSHSQPGNPL